MTQREGGEWKVYFPSDINRELEERAEETGRSVPELIYAAVHNMLAGWDVERLKNPEDFSKAFGSIRWSSGTIEAAHYIKSILEDNIHTQRDIEQLMLRCDNVLSVYRLLRPQLEIAICIRFWAASPRRAWHIKEKRCNKQKAAPPHPLALCPEHSAGFFIKQLEQDEDMSADEIEIIRQRWNDCNKVMHADARSIHIGVVRRLPKIIIPGNPRINLSSNNQWNSKRREEFCEMFNHTKIILMNGLWSLVRFYRGDTDWNREELPYKLLDKDDIDERRRLGLFTLGEYRALLQIASPQREGFPRQVAQSRKNLSLPRPQSERS